MGDREQGTGNRGQGTGNRGQGTGDREEVLGNFTFRYLCRFFSVHLLTHKLGNNKPQRSKGHEDEKV